MSESTRQIRISGLEILSVETQMLKMSILLWRSQLPICQVGKYSSTPYIRFSSVISIQTFENPFTRRLEDV